MAGFRFLFKYIIGPFIGLLIARTALEILHAVDWYPEQYVASLIMTTATTVDLELVEWLLSVVVGVSLYVITYYFLFIRVKHGKITTGSNAVTGPGPQQNLRRLDTRTRQKLVDDLKLLGGEYGNVKIILGPGQYHPFAQMLDGIFSAAGWKTSTNLTPQESHSQHYYGGVEVKGFNRHLVDAVCTVLRDAGVLDARTNIVPLGFGQDNPKWRTAQHRLYLLVGHVEHGPQ